MNFVLELFGNLLYFIYFLCIGQLFFDFQRRKQKYAKIFLMFIVVLTTIIWVLDDAWIKLILHAVSILVVMAFYFKEKWKTLLGFYFGIISVLSMLSTMVEMVVAEMMVFWKIDATEKQIELIAQIILLLYIWGNGKYFKEKYPSGLKKIGIKYLFFFVIILFIDAAIVVLLGDFVINNIQTYRRGLFVFTYVCVVVGILIQIILLINTLITRNVYKENEALAKQFLDNQKEHYLYLEKREEETKKFRHDIKNHLLLLRHFINHQDYEQAESYLDTMNEKLNAFSSHISVNNGIADAVFNKFYADAQEKGVEIKVNGHFPMECYISAYDICTVLSNLLSNAILAESQSGGNSISVNIRYTLDELFLVIENDYNHELQIQGDVFKTTKTDSLGHGFGLGNVKECVEKGGGHITISTDNHRFKVMISMKNEKEETE